MSEKTNDSNGSSPSDVEAMLAEYVERLNAGEAIDIEAIRTNHREEAEELIDQLRLLQGVYRDAASSTDLGTLGDYTLRRQIGRGGMGVVYEAWQNSMDRQVALKVLPKAIAVDTKSVTRFVREAQLAGKLDHPNVVHVHGMGLEEQIPYYAMEYVEGETLAQILGKIKDAELETPFGAKDEVAYFGNLARAFADVADGLQHAHSKGVTHRDIKPSNLILDGQGRLRILDFGLAHLEGQESLTVSGDVVGTPLYMSPEQARREKIPVDHRTDIYSLGATLYEGVTNRPPFRGKDHADTLSQIIERDPPAPRDLNARVPPDLETIALKCLRKAPLDRYGTAEALGQDLRRFVRGDPIEARPQPTWEKMARRVARHKGKVVAAVFAFFMILLSATLGYKLSVETEKVRPRQYEEAVRGALMKLLRGQAVLSSIWAQPATTLRPGAWAESPSLALDHRKTLEEDAIRIVTEAMQELDSASKLLPESFEAYFYKARALKLLGRNKEAIEQLDKTIEQLDKTREKKEAGFAPAAILRAELLGEAGEFATAVQEGRNWERSWLEAYRAVTDRRWEDAARAYEELLRLGKEPYLGASIETLMGYGNACLRLKRWNVAEVAFVTARERWAGFVEPWLLLGKTYYLQGAKEDAKNVFEELYQRMDGGKEAALWTTILYRSLRDYEESRQWVKRVENPYLQAQLEADFYFRLRRYDEAMAAAENLVALKPENPASHRTLGWALVAHLRAGGNWRDASERCDSPNFLRLQETAETARRLDPENHFTNVLSREVSKAEAECERAEEFAKDALGAPSGVLEISDTAGKTHHYRARQTQQGFFDSVRNLGPTVNSPFWDSGPSVTLDGLELFFASERPGGAGNSDIWLATRRSPDEPFENVRRLTEINSPARDRAPNISADDKTLYFTSQRDGRRECGRQRNNLYMATRSHKGGRFGGVVRLAINSESDDEGCSVSLDRRTLYFSSLRDQPGTCEGLEDLYVATRSGVVDDAGNAVPFGNVRPLVELNTLFSEDFPSISSDGQTLFYSDRFGLYPESRRADIWWAQRRDPASAFEPAANLGTSVNTDRDESAPFVTRDWPASGSRLYFSSNRQGDEGEFDIYQATWHLDCNANGVDDLADIQQGTSQDQNENGVPDECDFEDG